MCDKFSFVDAEVTLVEAIEGSGLVHVPGLVEERRCFECVRAVRGARCLVRGFVSSLSIVSAESTGESESEGERRDWERRCMSITAGENRPLYAIIGVLALSRCSLLLLEFGIVC